jgi:hypothetical protein
MADHNPAVPAASAGSSWLVSKAGRQEIWDTGIDDDHVAEKLVRKASGAALSDTVEKIADLRRAEVTEHGLIANQAKRRK